MIQYITFHGKKEWMANEKIVVTELHSPKSLDEFKINVIDLSDKGMWKNDKNSNEYINSIRDLINLDKMIRNSQLSKILVILPQTLEFEYNYTYDSSSRRKTYKSKIDLKNMIPNLIRIIGTLVELPTNILVYENTRTKICDRDIDASFYFYTDFEVLTQSIGSNKCTTVLINDIYVTSLNIESSEDLIGLLVKVGLVAEKNEIPEWIKNMSMFDDTIQNNIVIENNKAIELAKIIIDNAEAIIEKNNKYKSILCSSGEQLVSTIFEILQEILECDLSEFNDLRNEDLKIKFDDITFIGEIKGVNTNVKSEHISQLDTHLHGYHDRLSDEGKNEIVKSLLIINHQRNKESINREPVHKKQIELAKRNGSLIIETITLLKIFEKFKKEEITVEEIKKLLVEEIGLLQI